jgi:hypothetical protein
MEDHRSLAVIFTCRALADSLIGLLDFEFLGSAIKCDCDKCPFAGLKAWRMRFRRWASCPSRFEGRCEAGAKARAMLLAVPGEGPGPIRLMSFIRMRRQKWRYVNMWAVIIGQVLTRRLLAAIENIAHVVTGFELQKQVVGPYGVSLRQKCYLRGLVSGTGEFGLTETHPGLNYSLPSDPRSLHRPQMVADHLADFIR